VRGWFHVWLLTNEGACPHPANFSSGQVFIGYDLGDLRSFLVCLAGMNQGYIDDCLIYALQVHHNWIRNPRNRIHHEISPQLDPVSYRRAIRIESVKV